MRRGDERARPAAATPRDIAGADGAHEKLPVFHVFAEMYARAVRERAPLHPQPGAM